MKRNSFLLFVAILFTSVSVSFAQKKLSILGDSYSTYYGYVTPDTNLCWYGVPEEKRENDVKRVEDTWWYLLINEHGYQMERNNSYSGSTVCHTGYEKADYSDRSFVTRMDSVALMANGLPEAKLYNITLRNIKVKQAPKAIQMDNVVNLTLDNVEVNGKRITSAEQTD